MRAALGAVACLGLGLALAAPALAWKGELASGVRPISEVNAKAEKGDVVVVEGTIAEVTPGTGSNTIVKLEDATGSVLIRVPEHMLRNLNEGRAPEVGRKVRVSGSWTRAYLDRDIWGIQAQNAERVE